MYFYKNKLSILSLSNECLVPNFLKLHEFASLKSKFLWGRTPRPPTSYLAKGQWSLKISLYKNHPPTHTHTRTEPPFASEKSRTRRKYKRKHRAPKHTSYTPYGFFFFFFFAFRCPTPPFKNFWIRPCNWNRNVKRPIQDKYSIFWPQGDFFK